MWSEQKEAHQMLQKVCERMRHQLIALPSFGYSTSHIQHVQVRVCARVRVGIALDPFLSGRGGRTTLLRSGVATFGDPWPQRSRACARGMLSLCYTKPFLFWAG